MHDPQKDKQNILNDLIYFINKPSQNEVRKIYALNITNFF